MRCRASFSIWLIIFAWTRLAHAQVTELPPTVVETEPESAVALTTGIAEVVLTDSGSGAHESLADVVSSVPGIQVRAMGGPGSFAAVSLRGIGPDNVLVVLDDLPLASATLGPIDLSLYPPESLRQVEVWRGSGPIRFASPLGGVLRLVTLTPTDHTEVSAHAGYGSFATRSAHLTAAGPAGDLRYAAYLGYQGSAGDYLFYDDRNTPYNSTDDRVSVRRNNRFDALTTRLKAEADGPGDSTLRLVVGGSLRTQGIPGPVAATPAVAAHASQAEALGRAALVEASLLDGGLRLGLGSDWLVSTRDFHDPRQEVGLRITGAASRLDQVGLDLRAELLEAASEGTEISPRVQWDHFRQQAGRGSDALDEVSLDRERLTLGVGVEQRIDLLPHLRLVPSLRIDAVRDGGSGVAHDVTSEWSPRLGALWSVSACELRANVGRFHRYPTLLERYGDLVTSVASPSLSPEHGFMIDLGSRCHLASPVVRRLQIEANTFGHDGRSLIVITQNSQRWLHAENAGHVRTWGLESSAHVEEPYAALTVSYTLTVAHELAAATWLDGKAVPGIPRHRFDALLQVGPAWLTLSYEVTLVSLTFLDRGNLTPVPERLLNNAALTYKHTASGLEASLSFKNLFNQLSEKVPLPDGSVTTQGLSDFLGYPMPGRSVFAGLTWRTP